MLSYQIAGKIITEKPKTLENYRFVTINGKLVVDNSLDHMKLIKLARKYSEAVRKTLNLIWKGHSHREAYFT